MTLHKEILELQEIRARQKIEDGRDFRGLIVSNDDFTFTYLYNWYLRSLEGKLLDFECKVVKCKTS